jgi:lipopolysaccharide biosynthesis glycosyltransferase
MYINSGVLLINSKAIRRDKIEEKIIDFVNAHKYLPHHDQTAINAICYKNVEKLPVKFAVFNFQNYHAIKRYNDDQDKRYRYSDQEIDEAFHSPVMLHYAGWEKPWMKYKICYYREYWWYYAKKTDYYEEMLNKYGYTNAEVLKLLAISKLDFIRNKN